MKEKANIAYIALGSNLGNRESNLLLAVKAINSLSDTAVSLMSNIYETEPVGNLDQGSFLNMALRITTKFLPHELLEKTQEIEVSLGKKVIEKWGPRTIDIDILMYENEVISDERLVLPHPEMYRRAFVLVPLSEVFLSDTDLLFDRPRSLLYHASECDDFNNVNIYKDIDEKIFNVEYLNETFAKDYTFKIQNEDLRIGNEILAFEEIASTNEYAKKLAQRGAAEGIVVTASKQKSGRGRRGRRWNSESPDGIWFSVVLRPGNPTQEVAILTHLFAVSVVEAIYKVSKIKCGIKWPNDIIFEGKKVCGILCESSITGDKCDYVIAGVGINVNQAIFEGELKKVATSLRIISGSIFDKGEIFNELLKISDKFYETYKSGGKQQILDLSRLYSITTGQEIRVFRPEDNFACYALGISETGNLIVRHVNGRLEEIESGEVSIRGEYDVWSEEVIGN